MQRHPDGALDVRQLGMAILRTHTLPEHLRLAFASAHTVLLADIACDVADGVVAMMT